MAATAAMNFIRPDAVHDIEKPYLLQYPVRDKSQPRTNISHIMHGEIQVFNLRDHLKTLTFEKSGISTLYFEDASIPHDWDDTTTVRTKFLPVVAVKLKELLGAESVQVFEHIIRRRHSTYPISTGDSYKHLQPSSVVHIDTTVATATAIASQLDPENAKHRKQCQIVNVWLPLHGPLRDWPLAVCDMSTLRSPDLTPTDQVFQKRVVESIEVYHNPRQQWYFLKDQLPTEALVFLQADSKYGNTRPGVPHASFDLGILGATPRKSIEIRCVVWYNETM